MNQLSANVKTAVDAISIGNAAIEYLTAESEMTAAYKAYRLVRDAFLRKLDPSRELRVNDVIYDPNFQIATKDLYDAYLDAKRIERNAKRRLDNKFRRLMAGGNHE